MVATRKKTTPASTGLTAEQVRETYQTSIAILEKKIEDQAAAIECHVQYRLEQGAKIVKLEGERDRANHAAAEMREFSRQIQGHRDNKLNEYEQDNRRLVKENADLATQVDSLAGQLEESGAAQNEAQAARIALLEREKADLRALVDRATASACEWQEKYDQAQKLAMPALLANIGELEQKIALVETTNKTLKEQLRKRMDSAPVKRVEELECQIRQAEQDLTQAQTERDAAAAIVDDLSGQLRALGEQNTALRTALVEQEEAGAAANPQEVADLRAQLASKKEYADWQDQEMMRLQGELQWHKDAFKRKGIESTTKIVASAMRDAVRGKGEHFTAVYRDDIAKATGLSPNTAGKHMNYAVDWNLFSGYRVPEKAIVADSRLGKREVEKEILHVIATDLLERPGNWERLDGKEHGGARRRCKGCGAENTLRTIPHTVCLNCGAEDCYYPDDARAALEKARELQPEDAFAAVEEAAVIFAQSAPAPVVEETPAPVAQVEEESADPVIISEIQDEIQSAPAEKADPMTLARAAGFPALVLVDHGVKIPAGSTAWSRWMHMSHATDAQVSAVLASFKGQPAPFDSACQYCDSPETVWDPSGSGRRVSACYVYPERRKAQEVQASTHKAADLRTGRIVEVQEP